jgi:hypothetical protein
MKMMVRLVVVELYSMKMLTDFRTYTMQLCLRALYETERR